MPRRRTPAARLLRQASEIAVASQSVIALRSDIIHTAMTNPAAGDYPELQRMVTEKAAAAAEIGFGIWGAWIDAGIALSSAVTAHAIRGTHFGADQAMRLAEDAANATADAALAPLHRHARANHRRLQQG